MPRPLVDPSITQSSQLPNTTSQLSNWNRHVGQKRTIAQSQSGSDDIAKTLMEMSSFPDNRKALPSHGSATNSNANINESDPKRRRTEMNKVGITILILQRYLNDITFSLLKQLHNII
jgi:hypothetical protein